MAITRRRGRKAISTTAIAAIVVVVIIIAGVGGYLVVTSSKKPVNITVLVSTGSETQQYLSIVAKDYMASHPGVKISFEPVGFGEMVTTALAALKEKAPSPDIIMYYPSQAPDYAPYLLNLASYESGSNAPINGSNIIKAEMYSGGYLLATNGTILKTLGVAIHSVFGYVLVYQKSIFDNQTLASAFQKEYGFSFNPTTWTNYTQMLDAAQFIKANKVTQYSLLIPDSAHHADIDMWMSMLYGYGQGSPVTHIPASSSPNYWSFLAPVNGKWQPTFNNSVGVQALEMWKQLIQFEPSLSVQPIGYDQQEDFFATGSYAMGIAWTSFLPYYNNATVSKVAGNVGIALLPGSPTGYTGVAPTFLGVNPNSKSVSTDIQFISYALSNAEYEKGVNQLQYVPGTYTGLAEASKSSNLSWTGPFLTYLSSVKVPLQLAASYSVLGSLTGTLIPYMNQQINNYFTGTESANAALQTAASEWMKYIQSNDITL